MLRDKLICLMLLALIFIAPGKAAEPENRTGEEFFPITEAMDISPSPAAAAAPSPAGGGKWNPSVAAATASLLGEPGNCAAETVRTFGTREPEFFELPLWYTEEDVAIIANVVLHECPYCSDRQQELTAQVVVNRVFHPAFLQNTVRDVVCAPGQYTPAYCYQLPDPNDPDETVQRAFAAARKAVNGQVDCPRNVVYQANFRLGHGIYEQIWFESEWYSSMNYFCYV